MEKFGLLMDLGKVRMSADPRLVTFTRRNRARLVFCNGGITDANFSNQSRILKPGDELGVRVFRQVVPGKTTAEERLEFCRRLEGNVFVGAQGVLPIFQQKRDKLPKGLRYNSFDNKECLWKDSSGCYGMPSLVALSRGGFNFDISCFENPLDDRDAFFSFRVLSV